MKKSLIIASLAAFAIAGCATAPKQQVQVKPTHKPNKAVHHQSKPSDKATKPALTTSYQCEQDAKVVASYQPHRDLAVLNINAPSWKLNNQQLTLKAEKTASGMNFVNRTNPNSQYQWHTKGEIGLLSVIIGDKEYTLNCNKIA